jgi:type I restriction enzyme, S subunit
MPERAMRAAAWTKVAFGEVVRQVKDRVDPEQSGLDRYVAGEHMDTDDLRLRRWGEIGDGYIGPAFHMRFKPGHVLYGSRRTYLRKVAVADFEGITANTTYVLEPKDPSVLLPELLPFIMQTEAFNQHSVRESKGSVNPYVNFSDLAWYEFALPPIEEQRRLTAGFQALELFRRTLLGLREAAEGARRSLLREFFAGRSDLTTAPAKEVGHIQLGQQRHPKFASGDNVRPYLRVANVFDGWIDYGDIERMHFPSDELDKFELQVGDILLNEGQSLELVGRSAIYDGGHPGMCFQKTLLRFRCSERLLPEYAQAYFQFCLNSGIFARIAVQTTSVAHLTAVRFKDLPIPLAPVTVQEWLVDRVRVLDDQNARVAKRSADLEALHRVFRDSHGVAL